ncbi:lycopene cyclase family protein [Rhodococcus sp. NPDC058639]|uniref:lycopene cyclase family protein n=1 Tax=Rhodococcus sp. NPDC058639 TaxID=3346570 RepID=UPI00364BDF57
MSLRTWTGPLHGGIVILGGGLSGLSLAAHLAATRPRPGPVLVVDDAARDITAASWASWTRRTALLDSAATETFDRMRVYAGGHDRTLALGHYRYRVVHGAALVAAVRRHTDPVPDVGSVTGHVVDVDDADRPLVTLDDGRELRPDWVFDARGPVAVDSRADAALDFLGVPVRAEDPLFDPHVPLLFDFRTDQTDRASFVYVLPTDAHHALVEHTCFLDPANPGVPADVHLAALRVYFSEVLGVAESAYEFGASEQARLPLVAQPAERSDGHIVRIGAAAGLLKASSGYAYEQIQRDCEAIASSFAQHGHPFDLPKRHSRFERYDRALLAAVVERPGFLEDMFAALFARTSAEPVLRFLDEDTSLRDEARLFASLPAGPLIRAMTGR